MPSSTAGNAAAVSDVVMPKLGLTMTEGVLSEWHVAPGDRVRPGQVMFVVETDKIANEIEAAGEGEVIEILVQAGETVPVGTPLARWTGGGAAGQGEAPPGASGGATARGQASEAMDTGRESAAPVTPPVQVAGGRIRATPLARRMARQSGIELAAVRGSGPQGRIKAADVATAMSKIGPAAARPALQTASSAAQPSTAQGAGQAPASRTAPLQAVSPAGAASAGAAPDAPAGVRRIAVSSRHLAMVRRVSTAKRDIPHFYLSQRAEVSALLALRQSLNGAGGPKVTLNHMLLKAVGRALLACPEANRIWADDALLAMPASDVGVVVDTGEGLFIPVLPDAGRLPLDALATAAGDLATRARSGTLRHEELDGGAVSVSNVGMAGGVEAMAPIINPPQCAMMGVGAVCETFRPDAQGRPVPARELVLTLACDHRVLDGMSGARFLAAVVHGLETPHSLLRTTD